jgi:hypothetical protein
MTDNNVDQLLQEETQDFESKLIPARVLYFLSKTFDRRLVEGAEAGALAAFESLLVIVVEMYEAEGAVGWSTFLNKLWFGHIQETKNYGTSSVFQGLAVDYFTDNPNEAVIAMAHCGTDGMTCQVAIQQPAAEQSTIVHILSECKSVANEPCSNKLKLGSYFPKSGAWNMMTTQRDLMSIISPNARLTC